MVLKLTLTIKLPYNRLNECVLRSNMTFPNRHFTKFDKLEVCWIIFSFNLGIYGVYLKRTILDYSKGESKYLSVVMSGVG